MPWDVKVDVGQQLVTCRLHGRVTVADAATARDAIPQNPLFRAEFNHLIDLSGATEWMLSGEEMRKLAKEPDPFSPRSIRVIVAPTDLVFGMARMYGIFGERQHPNQAIVRSIDEAHDILKGRVA